MQFILNYIFVPIQDLGSIILAYREAQVSLQNFDALMAKPVEIRPEDPVDIGSFTSLEFRNVVFRHRSARHNAIDGISFSVRSGESIAFVGPSGSGKSTLLKLLVGLYRPKEGSILFDGVPVQSIRYNRARRQIGFVTQDTQLFSGTVRANLLFVKPGATEEELLAALERAEARHLVGGPKGLDTMLGEGGTRLSGGEKQRLSIARALLREPQLLIFDEATAALDSITEEAITGTLNEIAAVQQQMIISIAHRLSTIRAANRIYVLERGRIAEQGTHEELLEKKGLYSALWRQQVGAGEDEVKA